MTNFGVAGWARALVVVAALGGGGQAALAQSVNDQCSSPQGSCPVRPGLVGTSCICYGPTGPTQGAIIPMGGGFAQRQALSNACRTVRGFCQTAPAPVGSPCGCFGDAGTVVLR